MRYVGGKAQIVTWVGLHLASLRRGCQAYLEPFVGSAAVFAHMARHFESAVGGDAHEDLILLWQAIRDGWEPPEAITPEEYAALKTAPPSALRGLVGFGASFGGKWFGGYAKDTESRSFYPEARRAVIKKADALRGTTLVHRSYDDHDPGPGTLVYCDPPYAGTQGYNGTRFDADRFWGVMSRWAMGGARVVVSEYEAPAGWVQLAARDRQLVLKIATDGPGSSESRTERLFVWRGRSGIRAAPSLPAKRVFIGKSPRRATWP